MGHAVTERHKRRADRLARFRFQRERLGRTFAQSGHTIKLHAFMREGRNMFPRPLIESTRALAATEQDDHLAHRIQSQRQTRFDG